jgi:hypothetical protein
MLLTDGSPNDTLDLQEYESAILDVAHNESIDLSTKLDLALAEVSENVLDVLIGRSNDLTAVTRRARGVSDVVVTPQMKRWHATHTLEVFYRDAFNNQLNDRYQQKSLEYRELARQERLYTLRFGIGLVSNPVPIAGAPVLTTAQASLGAATYFIQVSWISSLGQEGAPGPILTVDTLDGSGPVVSVQNIPAGITAFNVFEGLSPDRLTLQNTSPVPVGSSFALGAGGLISGRPPGLGQSPDYYVTGGSGLTRG